jgi:hypothetical protein
MKSYFFVIGCNSVELSADGIRISQESGAVSIAWPDVKVASLASEEPSQGLEFMRMAAAGQFWRLRAQPDLASSFGEMARWARESPAALWRQGAEGPLKYDVLLIAHSRGIVQVFIEPGGPERDQLLAGLRTRLGSLWLSEEHQYPHHKNMRKTARKRVAFEWVRETIRVAPAWSQQLLTDRKAWGYRGRVGRPCAVQNSGRCLPEVTKKRPASRQIASMA